MARLVIAVFVALAATAVMAHLPPPPQGGLHGPHGPQGLHPMGPPPQQGGLLGFLKKGLQAAQAWWHKESAVVKAKAAVVGKDIKEFAQKDEAWLKANSGKVINALKTAWKHGAAAVAQPLKQAGHIIKAQAGKLASDVKGAGAQPQGPHGGLKFQGPHGPQGIRHPRAAGKPKRPQAGGPTKPDVSKPIKTGTPNPKPAPKN